MSSPGLSHVLQDIHGEHSAQNGSGNINGSKVLKSWKEIARHLGCSVRTVQRWEGDFNLPVRRPHGKGRGSVIVVSSELDSWVRSCPLEMRNQSRYRNLSTGSSVVEHIQESQRLRGELRESRRRLLDSVARLRQTLTKMMLE